MLHSMLKWLAARGHQVTVVAARLGQAGALDGVTVRTFNVERWVERLFVEADLAITHLDYTNEAVAHARATGTPLVHLIHNSKQMEFYELTDESCQLAIFNSEWLADEVAWPHRSIVVNPPVFAEDYKTKPGDAILLANLTEGKGAHVFWKLAASMPERKFLAVLGAYGAQVVPRQIPSNVELIENTPDMKSIYGRTRLVVMPSVYESWGRVGVEAMASGIPVIAHPTPGLKESLGSAGIFCDRDESNRWIKAIRALDDSAAYDAAAKKARARSKQLDPTKQLEALEATFCDLGAEVAA